MGFECFASPAHLNVFSDEKITQIFLRLENSFQGSKLPRNVDMHQKIRQLKHMGVLSLLRIWILNKKTVY